MDKYFRIRVPFGTKSFLKKKQSGLIISGDAYFVYDTKLKQIVHEYIHLHKANYRQTDNDMIKPTDYYKDKVTRSFRDNYLDLFNVVEPHSIHETTYRWLNDEQITIVNNYFLSMQTTIKKQFSLLSGSNISGAETKSSSSPILCNDNEYTCCNFANPIKHFCANKRNKIIIKDQTIKTYKLIDVIKLNLIDGFKEKFWSYNEHLEYEDIMPEILIDENEKTYENFVQKAQQFTLKENQELFIDSFLNQTIDDYQEFINDKKKLERRLRSFYAANISYYIKQKYIPSHSTIHKANLKCVENAHIISVASLLRNISKETLTKIVDPYNCLRIDSSYHQMWDFNEIDFDEKGRIIKNGKVLMEQYLDMDNMPKYTLKYFEEYLNKN